MRTPVTAVPATAAACLAVAGLAVGLPLFQPWRLFTDTVVDEAFRASAVHSAPAASTGSVHAAIVDAGTDSLRRAGDSGPVTLARGTFISHEHDTSGTARCCGSPTAARVLRLEGLDTSDGPDLEGLADRRGGGRGQRGLARLRRRPTTSTSAT